MNTFQESNLYASDDSTWIWWEQILLWLAKAPCITYTHSISACHFTFMPAVLGLVKMVLNFLHTSSYTAVFYIHDKNHADNTLML